MKKFITLVILILCVFSMSNNTSYAKREKTLPTIEQMREINAFGDCVEALISKEQHSKACFLSYEMIRRYPNEPDAYFAYAKASYHAGYPKRAIEYYYKCLKIDDTYYQAYCNIGYIYYQKKEYKEAIKYYNKAMKIIAKNMNKKRNRQDYGLMLSNRALAKYHLGNLTSSLNDYNASMPYLSDYSGLDHIYFNRGLCRYDMGDIDGALKDYKRAQELNPEYEYIYYDKRG